MTDCNKNDDDVAQLIYLSFGKQIFFRHFTVEKTRLPGADQDFTEGDSIVGPPKPVPCRGVRGHPRKCDFRRFEAKSWCFEVSFFLSQNVILINILQFL